MILYIYVDKPLTKTLLVIQTNLIIRDLTFID